MKGSRLKAQASLLELRYEIAAKNRVHVINHYCTYEDWNNPLRNKERFAIGG